MEAAPPRGRPEFDFDHITVHHLRLNKNAESTKSPHQMWSPTRSDHRKPLEGREGRTAGERERSWERTRLRSDLCRRCRKVAGKRIWRLAGGRRDSVAGGPAIRQRGRGSQLTDWVEVHQFFFFSVQANVRWFGADQLTGGQADVILAVGFFFCFGTGDISEES
jgi:hypothetical protein